MLAPMNIRIIEYTNDCKEAVRALFLDIYPDRPDVADRMGYDVETDRHVTTKLARVGEKIVGQAGVFYLKDLPRVAGIGWHVHPKFRRRGIGSLLAKTALAEAGRRGVKRVIVEAATGNLASIALAKNLGFAELRDACVAEGNTVKLAKEL
jgi:RimJ/RimL family protein N-acetyltransferase